MKDLKSEYSRVRPRGSMQREAYRCKKNEHIYVDEEKGVFILTLSGMREIKPRGHEPRGRELTTEAGYGCLKESKGERKKMKKIGILSVLILLTIAMVIPLGMAAKDKEWATIQDGTIIDTVGNPITVGYDQWGYNYQAHIFVGWYWNSARPEVPWTYETLIAAEKSTTWLIMRWNDAWLSNMDRDGDNLLDRHYGFDSYIGSGALCTNHQFGSYIDVEEFKWNYYVKMVSAPEGAYKETHDDDEEYWHLSDGTEMGTVIWGAFARILQIYNDQGTGDHGVEYNPAGPTGFGYYK